MEEYEITKYDGGWSYTGEIKIAEIECHVCGKEKQCLVSGAGEYARGRICRDCIDEAFEAAPDSVDESTGDDGE